MQDIDLLAQAGTLLAGASERSQLAQLAAMKNVLSLASDDASTLEMAVHQFWTVRTAARLVFGDTVPEDIGIGAAGFLSRATGKDGLTALERSLVETRRSVEAIVSAALAT